MTTHILNVRRALQITALSLCLATIAGSAIAQTLVTPTLGPNMWDHFYSNIVKHIRTATINYSSSGIIAGYISDGASMNVDITDLATGSATTAFPVAARYGTPSGYPDIVICNDPNNTPLTEYFIAVLSYPYYNSLSMTTGVEVDYYSFTDVAGVITGLGWIGTGSYFTTTNTPTCAHLDGIADYSNTTVTGFPYCTQLMVTWDDPSVAGTVYADSLWINTRYSSSFGLLTPTFNAPGISPDVAGIKRTVGLGHDNIALLTYTNNLTNKLYYQEWDASAGTSTSAVAIDDGTMGYPIVHPAIDAIDDYNNNTSASHANYKIAAEVDSSSNYLIRTYDNLLALAIPPHWDCSQVADLSSVPGYTGPPYNQYEPSISMGGPYLAPLNYNDATSYLVTGFINYSASADILLMYPIDYTNSTSIAVTGGSNNYYWTSDSPPGTTGGYYGNSVSSPVNRPTTSNGSLVAWCLSDGSGGTIIEYKTTGYAYAFRQGSVSSNNTAAENWKTYPNPASNNLVIVDPAAAGVASGYEIVDMIGKTVLSGSLVSGSQQIDLSSLPIGDYILKLSRADGASENRMFVKQ